MGLEHYTSRILVGLAKPPSKYHEDFVKASINAFINNLEMIDNVILNKYSQSKLNTISADQKARRK